MLAHQLSEALIQNMKRTTSNLTLASRQTYQPLTCLIILPVYLIFWYCISYLPLTLQSLHWFLPSIHICKRIFF